MLSELTTDQRPVLLVPGLVGELIDVFPDWQVAYWELLFDELIRNRYVDVFPPHDKHGYRKARDLLEKINAFGPERIRIIRPKSEHYAMGWCVGDALQAGWTGAQLRALIDESAQIVRKESIGSARPKPVPPPAPLDAVTLPPELDPNASVPIAPGTDLWTARRFTDRHGMNMRYTAERGWLVWSGSKWQVDEKGVAVASLAMESAESLYDEIRHATEREKMFAVAKAGAQKRSIEAAIWMGRSHCVEQLTAFDANPMILNCRNGIIDLTTGELKPHDRTAYCSLIAGCEYHPEAQAPRWMQFIGEIALGNAELMAYLQQMAGYLLTGDVSEQCLFFMHGDGSNGKTTFVETIMDVMGEYALSAEPDMLMARQNAGIPNDVARLRGVRAAFMNETKQGHSFDESKLKNLTGGDKLTARFLREEFFDFKPVHKLILRGNHKPTVNGTDEGIWRRLRLIPFDLRLTDEQKDRRLLPELERELPGVLAWMVQGCLSWQKTGLVSPTIVRDAVKEYRDESDTLGRFIEECCTVRKVAQVKSSELHKAYRAFCDAAGERYLSAKDFPAELEHRGFKRTRTATARMTSGLELKTALDADWRSQGEQEKF